MMVTTGARGTVMPSEMTTGPSSAVRVGLSAALRSNAS
jgi:hypothetical protein